MMSEHRSPIQMTPFGSNRVVPQRCGIMVSRVMHRVEVINRASERIMAGDLTGRLPVGMITAGGDEFDRLSINLNRMLDRIEKLVEGMRQVSTDIAHDLRTPLTRLSRTLEKLGARD